MNKKRNTIFLLMLFMSTCLICSCGSSSSKWDSLSDDEKEWYERNYGNGKAEEIDRAIQQYKDNY